MILISILVRLGLEFFVSNLDQIRNYSWFKRLIQRLDVQCNRYSFWSESLGILLTLAIPLSLLFVINDSLNSISVILSLVLGVFIFIYSMGPDFNNLLNKYLDSIKVNDDGE